MKPDRIIIATIAIFLVITLLGGCNATTDSANPSSTESDAGINLSSNAVKPVVNKTPAKLSEIIVKAEKNVELKLKASRQGDTVTVRITLDNPKQQAISAVQTWLTYDPDTLEGVNLSADDSDFKLQAPYENTFDEINGLAMIGHGTTGAVTDKSLNVAEVIFNIKKSGTTMVDLYDYQEDLSGHVSVNTVINDEAYNILLRPKSPALIIEN